MIPSTDGVRVALHDLGGPGGGGGAAEGAPVLLFSHATGFCGRVFEPLAAHLSDRFHCVALDYRGHGCTKMPPSTTLHWSGMGDDALAVLQSGALPSGRPLYGVAHSMGGAALVLAAARQPDLFRSLWLFEPVIVPPGMLPGLDSDTPNPMADAAARRRASFASFDEAIANFAAKPPLDQLHPDALRAYVHHGFARQPDGTVTLRCSPETEAAVYRGAAGSGAWEVLPSVEIPVAVSSGERNELGELL
jgi:pimeloyl-ACP methyl ester carboxylesterase